METKIKNEIQTRLEYLRGELRAERISYGELAELQALAPYIGADDVELREAAGLPENAPGPIDLDLPEDWTLAQLISARRTCERFNVPFNADDWTINFDGFIGRWFDGALGRIMIGIEKDGYAHS